MFRQEHVVCPLEGFEHLHSDGIVCGRHGAIFYLCFSIYISVLNTFYPTYSFRSYARPHSPARDPSTGPRCARENANVSLLAHHANPCARHVQGEN